MNFMGKVVEIKDTQNHAYILESTLFFSVGYKVLLSQEKNGFIKCTKVSHNGKDKLIYDTSKFKTLESLMYVLKFDETLNILINFLDAIILVKNNGFMQCENILTSLDHIFVDCDNYNVYLIYLPINNEADNIRYCIFEAELKAMLTVILNTYNEQSPYIAIICEYMNKHNFTIEDICLVFNDLQNSDFKSLDYQKSSKKIDRLISKSTPSSEKMINMKKLFSFTKKNK
jgi:hypothetical protein